jgi:SAM-dependent methyltransferase
VNFPKSDYKEYPKLLARDDFWGQVRRTVFGKPVSIEQIAMILDAIRNGLLLQPDDVVLDLACGNGALASQFYKMCASLHGVDSSEYLIEIANENFAIAGKTSFEADDARHYISNAPNPHRFTKVLCYGSFPYFSSEDAAKVIEGISLRFLNARRIMIGNLPDADLAHLFYTDGHGHSDEMRNHDTQIGIWRSQSELRELVSPYGWTIEFSKMPIDFYAAHYRFDATLIR